MNRRLDASALAQSLTHKLLSFDSALSARIALPAASATKRSSDYWLARFGAHLGDIWLWAIIAYALWHWRVRGQKHVGNRERSGPFWRWIASVMMSTLGASILKRTIRRQRPRRARWLYTPGADGLSFPSGHASRMGANVAWAEVVLPGSGPLLGLMALLIGWSRVRLGIHYMGDVLVGYALGTGIGWGWRRLRWQVPTRVQRELARFAQWIMAF